MKTYTQDFERSTIEHERWTNAILRALHEMKNASAAGLDRHGYMASEGALGAGFTSPMAGSIPPPAPSSAT